MQGPAKESECETPLMLAIWHRQEEVAELLIRDEKTNVNLNNGRGMPPLLQASFAGTEGIVRALLQRHDMDINFTDIHCRNALSLAASQGHATIVQMLLDHGEIDGSLRDSHGRSIFARAAKNGHERVVEILRPMVGSAGNFLGETDRQAILDTLCRGSAKVLKTILEIDPDIDCNSRDSWGTTILHRAAYRGYEKVLQVLLSHTDVDPSATDKFGLTALDWARYRGNKTVTVMLQRHTSSARLIHKELSDTMSPAGSEHGKSFLDSDARKVSVDGCNISSLSALVGEMPGEIWCVAFSNDGRRLATGSDKGEISIWQSDTAKQLWRLSDNEVGVSDLSWSPDDSLLLSCGRDGVARLWDPDVSPYFLVLSLSLCSSLSCRNDQKLPSSCSLLMPRSQDGILGRTTPAVNEPLSSCAWDPNGNFFLLGSYDRSQSIRQVNTDKGPDSVSTWETAVAHKTEALALSRDGQKLARMTDDDGIHIFNVGTREVHFSMSMDSRPTSLSFSWDSQHILINTEAGKGCLFNIDTENFDRFYEGSPSLKTEYIIRAVFGGFHGRFVLSAAEGRMLISWELSAEWQLDHLCFE